MIYKRGRGKKKLFWMDDTINGIRYREPLKTSNWQEAIRKERARHLEIEQGKAGIRGPAARQTFNAAVDLYIEERLLHSAEKSCRTDRERSQALRRAFGEWPLKQITAESILTYQTKRKKTISSRSSRGSGTISGRTINMEVGLLARVLKKNHAWSRIADDIRMLPEDPKEARILQPDEKQRLLEVARSRDEWQITYCAAVIALNTTCRSCELRGLRWKFVDWQAMTVSIIRKTTKTKGGVRVLPLNADALVALMELRSRAELLSSHDPEHFVFPT